MVEHQERAPTDRARELIRQSLKVGAPGLAEPAREAIVRSIMLKLEGRGLLGASVQPPASSGKALTGKAQGAETFETIAKWGEDTFGPIKSERIAGRAAAEMDELRDDPESVEEAADVVICLARYPGLWAAVERKMAVNRKRRWNVIGDGTGYHIKDEPAPPASSGQGGR